MSKSDTPLPVIELESYPPVETWDDVVDLDPAAWPRRVERHSMLVPTTCFNCEAGCGLMAWVDPETQTIRKLEGNPHHPGSRGRNCAKGPATLNQIEDPERILYPLKRVGARGSGEFARVSWDEVLDDLAGRMRSAMLEGSSRRDHVPRWSPRRRWVHGSGAQVLGCRRAQLAHQRVLVLGPRRLRALVRLGSPFAGSCQRQVHSDALGAPGDGALLQPACAAHRRGDERGRETLRHRCPPSPTPPPGPTGGLRRVRAPSPCCCWPSRRSCWRRTSTTVRSSSSGSTGGRRWSS